MIPSFQCESETRLRFYFTTRELTDAEEERFLNGEGLPAGVGKDPPGGAICVYRPARGAETTRSATKDGVGEYHIIVTPEISQIGLWWWRGQGLNGEGKATVTTRGFTFNAVRAF